MAGCRRHGLCRVGDMAPTCQCVGSDGEKKRRHDTDISSQVSSALFDCCVLGGDSLPSPVGAVLNVSIGSVDRAQNCSRRRAPSNRHRPCAPSDSHWGKGCACRGGLSTRLDEGGVTIVAAAEKKVKYRCTMLCATHDILLKLHPG